MIDECKDWGGGPDVQWLRRREGKRIVSESGRRAEPEPVDPIAELLHLVGETAPLSKGFRHQKAQPTRRRSGRPHQGCIGPYVAEFPLSPSRMRSAPVPLVSRFRHGRTAEAIETRRMVAALRAAAGRCRRQAASDAFARGVHHAKVHLRADVSLVRSRRKSVWVLPGAFQQSGFRASAPYRSLMRKNIELTQIGPT